MSLRGDEFRRFGHQAVDMAADYLSGIPAGPVFRRMSTESRETLLNMPLPMAPLPGDEILRRIAGQIMPYPMGNGHPRFFGWVNSPPALMAVVTEILAAAMNPSCAGGDHAAIYLEHCVIGWIQQLLGFPTEGSAGLLVSGASAATLTALAAARHRAFDRLGIDVRKQGLSPGNARLRLYTSTQAHSCVQKSIELLGLGSECIRSIRVDEDFRISASDLRGAIEEDLQDGWHPFCIVGNAGSVNTGAVDPLDQLAEVASEFDLWFHVDGAYGAVAVIEPNSKTLFAGLDRADSIGLDPHKWMSVPVECGCILVRDSRLLRSAFSLVPPYLQIDPGKGIGNLPWFSEYGFQQTRGFRALKLWVTLAHSGISGLQQQIAQHLALARYLEERVAKAPDFELLSRGKLSIVCFRYAPPELAGNEEALNAVNKTIMEQVQAGGAAFLTNAILGGRFALRACILHYGTTEQDIKVMLETVLTVGARVQAGTAD